MKAWNRFVGGALVGAVISGGAAVAAPTGGGQGTSWRELMVGDPVQIAVAQFDRQGYQFYAGSGRVITVPFAAHNLYVLRLVRSPDRHLYFENSGDCPTLSLPIGAALENAEVPGASWRPFPPDYAYSGTTYVGMAPSWAAFLKIRWQSGTTLYGGYASRRAWVNAKATPFSRIAGTALLPSGQPYHPVSTSAVTTTATVVNTTVYNMRVYYTPPAPAPTAPTVASAPAYSPAAAAQPIYQTVYPIYLPVYCAPVVPVSRPHHGQEIPVYSVPNRSSLITGLPPAQYPLAPASTLSRPGFGLALSSPPVVQAPGMHR